MQNLNSSIHRRAAVLALAATTALAACATEQPEIACADLRVGDADTAVMVLTDGRSRAFDRTLSQFVERSDALFGSATLGLDDRPGIVVVATFDELGQVDQLAEFNLGGVGGDDVRRRANARAQAGCLAEASNLLAEPLTGEPANLLRALHTADALLDATGADNTAIVIHGFSRSDNDGFIVEEADLSTDRRPEVLELLQQADLVRSMDHSVVLVAPAEGIESGIAAADVFAFAELLCPLLSTRSCLATEVLS